MEIGIYNVQTYVIAKHAPVSTALREEIPEESKKFLIEAGLPRGEAYYLTFELHLPTMKEVLPGVELPTSYDRYRWLGSSGGNTGYQVCIEEGAGRILIVPESKGEPVSLVNPSVHHLGSFLVVYEEALDQFHNGWPNYENKEDRNRIADLLKERFQVHDAAAMAYVNSYWSVAIEEMRYGM